SADFRNGISRRTLHLRSATDIFQHNHFLSLSGQGSRRGADAPQGGLGLGLSREAHASCPTGAWSMRLRISGFVRHVANRSLVFTMSWSVARPEMEHPQKSSRASLARADRSGPAPSPVKIISSPHSSPPLQERQHVLDQAFLAEWAEPPRA